MYRLSWSEDLEVYLIDGTYELFRHFYALPSARDEDGREIAAVRGVVASRAWDDDRRCDARRPWRPTTSSSRSATICGPATRRAPASIPSLLAQFPLLEEALAAAGVVVWPMIEFEADDALAAGAVAAARDDRGRAGRSSARPTRISRSACAATASSSSIAARG